MQHDAAAAGDPAYFASRVLRDRRGWGGCASHSFVADGDAGGVIAQHQCRGIAVAGDVVHQPTLQSRERIELETAEQVRRKRARRRQIEFTAAVGHANFSGVWKTTSPVVVYHA